MLHLNVQFDRNCYIEAVQSQRINSQFERAFKSKYQSSFFTFWYENQIFPRVDCIELRMISSACCSFSLQFSDRFFLVLNILHTLRERDNIYSHVMERYISTSECDYARFRRYSRHHICEPCDWHQIAFSVSTSFVIYAALIFFSLSFVSNRHLPVLDLKMGNRRNTESK